jgi:hypothetical protein
MNEIKKRCFMFVLILFHGSLIAAEAPNTSPPVITNPPIPASSPATTKNTSSTLPTSSHPQNTSESFSLMLSDDEQKMISNAMSRNKSPTEDALVCHYLGGIVYSTPTNWTLWLNDQAYSSGSEIPGITILEVTNNKVNLKASDSKSKNGSWLEMGKTFCCDTGQTLAGDQRR